MLDQIVILFDSFIHQLYYVKFCLICTFGLLLHFLQVLYLGNLLYKFFMLCTNNWFIALNFQRSDIFINTDFFLYLGDGLWALAIEWGGRVMPLS